MLRLAATISLCLTLCLMVCLTLWPARAIAQTQASASATEFPLASTSAASPSARFELHCAGCHAHGGNIVRRGKNLRAKTLARNGYNNVAAIAQLIATGKGAMPAYADRLSPEEISAIAAYVQQQAAAGWPR